MIELLLQELNLIGVTKGDLNKTIPGYDLIRQIERYGILKFMTNNASLFTGRVLDFGSGTSPYRHLVSGEYVPFEKGTPLSADDKFDCIICNQVMQYIENPKEQFLLFRQQLNPGGWLVMTYATNWDEVEEVDIQRHTKSGMTRILEMTGFKIIKHERRSQVCFNNFKFPLGYGVVARRNHYDAHLNKYAF